MIGKPVDFLKNLWIRSLAGPCVLWVRKCKIEPCSNIKQWKCLCTWYNNISAMFYSQGQLEWNENLGVWHRPRVVTWLVDSTNRSILCTLSANHKAICIMVSDLQSSFDSVLVFLTIDKSFQLTLWWMDVSSRHFSSSQMHTEWGLRRETGTDLSWLPVDGKNKTTDLFKARKLRKCRYWFHSMLFCYNYNSIPTNMQKEMCTSVKRKWRFSL